MTEQAIRKLEFIGALILAGIITLSLIFGLGCAATQAQKESWEQIAADIKANETEDALRVAEAATVQYGKADAIITAQTTERTILNIKNDEPPLINYTGNLIAYILGGTAAGSGLLFGLKKILALLKDSKILDGVMQGVENADNAQTKESIQKTLEARGLENELKKKIERKFPKHKKKKSA